MVTRNQNVLAFTRGKNGLHIQAMNILACMLRDENLKVAIVTEDEVVCDTTFFDTHLQTVDVVLIAIKGDSPFVTVGIDDAKESSLQSALSFRYWDENLCRIDLAGIVSHLSMVHRVNPLWACILIGGKSSRMGRPKHLLRHSSGRTWLEECVDRVQPHVENIVLSGAGLVPESLAGLERVEDASGIAGPLGGIIGASNLHPQISWLLFACDMPLVTRGAIEWLVGQRKFGCWGVVPQRDYGEEQQSSGNVRLGGLGKKGLEPLFACYERQCGPIFKEIVGAGSLKIRDVVKNDKVSVVKIPQVLEEAWTNCNTPADLD